MNDESQEPRSEKQEGIKYQDLSIKTQDDIKEALVSGNLAGDVSMLVSTDETKVYKYHVQIPETWFAAKFAMWPNLSIERKKAIQFLQMEQVAKFINNHQATVILSGLPLEFEGWKIELIAAPESAYRQIVESLGLMLREQPEVIIYKNTDLGAEILALTKESRKEVSDE